LSFLPNLIARLTGEDEMALRTAGSGKGEGLQRRCGYRGGIVFV